ncbi:hypothetical protein NLG97_g1166 [Lecanicillium saksenae]|uniref:Uncharacterized protein n=1 Tax=Lecanicillium saksenae TaxID=468837 RepID=A0ACC1R5X7_9HYPO|nr:hypothetical protein NLG97_g1166 [Lecanicillium saksenae]
MEMLVAPRTGRIWVLSRLHAFNVAAAYPVLLYFYDANGLRRYPCQNILSGITPLAYGWEVGRRHHLFHTQRLHQQLLDAPVIRVGPNWLSFGRAAAVRDIYGFNSPCRKGRNYSTLKSDDAESLLLSTVKTVHTARRRMVAAAYAPGNIDIWEPRVAESAAALVSKLDALCTAPPFLSGAVLPEDELTFDANLWSMLYAWECAIKIGLSKDMGFIRQSSDLVDVNLPDGSKVKTQIIECLHTGSRAASTLAWGSGSFSWLKRITGVFSSWHSQSWTKAEVWFAFIDGITQERLERCNSGDDFADLVQPMIRDGKGGNSEISNRDRNAEVHQIVNGGGDRSGISLVNTLYYLAKHPETMVRLRDELDSSLIAEDIIAPWSKVKRMRYLRACINESMRLSPPVATDLLRVTPPDRSYMIAGELVPPNTNFSISAYAAHRDPRIFTDPEAFNPNRWLSTNGDQLREILSLVYIATIVHRYNFALPSQDWTMEWEDSLNLWPKELPLKIWRRELQNNPSDHNMSTGIA